MRKIFDEQLRQSVKQGRRSVLQGSRTVTINGMHEQIQTNCLHPPPQILHNIKTSSCPFERPKLSSLELQAVFLQTI